MRTESEIDTYILTMRVKLKALKLLPTQCWVRLELHAMRWNPVDFSTRLVMKA